MAIDTAVIPCGGLGTRLRPITEWVPKELLPVGLRPVLHWTLGEAAAAGLRRAIVVTNPRKPAVEAAARAHGGLEVTCVPQERPRGLGDALLQARPLLNGAPFMVMLPDNLFDGPNPTAAVLETYARSGLSTVLLAELPDASNGAVGATAGAAVRPAADGTLRVTAVTGKRGGAGDAAGGAPLLAPIGRFALSGDVWNEFDAVARALAPGAELDDVPVLQRLAAAGRLAGVVCAATFHDVGVPDGYRNAVAALA